MQYGRTSSFDRTLRKLSSSDRSAVEQSIARLVHAFDANQLPEGLGLKKLRKTTWEIRAGLAIRILFRLEGSFVVFVIVGTHDEIRRYLKQV
ncbi:MAG: hypothetical protein HYZ88_01230 [Candidatus Omnitrophica bacterium]|nr:hypothetical protein [Candidatus Omnitrophota bacterium]